jgi:hypothetical protein
LSGTSIDMKTLAIAIVASVILSVGISYFVLKGSMAPQGPQGIQGPIGPQGQKGDTGPQGLKGDTGLQGPKGDSGESGIAFSHWDVTWKVLDSNLNWGETLGTETFPAQFDYDWKQAALYGGRADYLGFEATMQIKVSKDGPIYFIVGSDDGSILYLDGNAIIDQSGVNAYYPQNAILRLSQGAHTLKLTYLEATSWARISFACDESITILTP